MALQSLTGPFPFPGDPDSVNGAISLGSALLDAADEKAACVFHAPKTGTISKIGFRTGTVTTGATLDVRLETVSLTTGDPSGTLATANSNGSQVVADTDDNVWFTVTLTAGHAATKGDLLAVVIVNPSVSPGNLNIVRSADHQAGFPYYDIFTTVWAKSPTSAIFYIEYSDGSTAVVNHMFPFSNVSSVNFNSSSTPDERGIIFQVPFKCRVSGAWVWVDLDNDATIKLYDSDGSTVLLSKAMDKDVREGATANIFFVEFSSAVVLNISTNYRLTIVPDTTGSIILQEFSVNAAAIMGAMDGGTNVHLTTRSDAGSWTQTTTDRPFMGIMIDQLDDAVGGATGMLHHPGMNANINA